MLPVLVTIVFLILFWLLTIEANAQFDKWKDILAGHNVNHWLETFVLAVAIAIGTIVILGVAKELNWVTFEIAFTTYWPIRWFVFDLRLNFIRGEALNYIGELETTSSVLDKFLHLLNRVTNTGTKDTSNWQYAVKSLALVLLSTVNYQLSTIL